MRWHKDGKAYFSEDGRFCAQRSTSSAIGPWYVTYDPDGQNPGWGQIIASNKRTRQAAIEAAETFYSVQIV